VAPAQPTSVAVRRNGTAGRALDVAERLVQTKGFNGFSYADLAAELSVSKASLHYHFAGKSDLGVALVERYATGFRHELERVEKRYATGPERLRGYAAIYSAVLRKRRMCLCGMLAAEYATLPAAMRAGVQEFFETNEAWLCGVLDAGLADRTLRFTGPSEEVARMLVAGLEGAMLLARPYGDVARFDSAADRLITGLVATRQER
jgi:TetR/AcrR family transcriptional regulator, transcriptional repressor for nem operon